MCLHGVYNCVINVYLTILHGVISVCITLCNWSVYWWFYTVYFECVYTPICINTLCKIKGLLCVYTWYWSKMEITHWYTVGTPYIHMICIAYCVWYTEYDVIWRHIMCITRCITRNSGPVIHLLPTFFRGLWSQLFTEKVEFSQKFLSSKSHRFYHFFWTCSYVFSNISPRTLFTKWALHIT